MLENIEAIIGITIAAISIVATIITLWKGKKTKTLNNILSKIPEYINEAESIFGSGFGIAKLSYVTNKVQIDCVKSNIKISDSDIQSKIESTLSTPQSKTNNEIIRNDIKE